MKFIEDNKFTFGKYKNKDIYEVFKDNPFYIRWCLNNINEFKNEIPKDIYYNLNKKSNEEPVLESRASGWLISWLI